MYYVFQGSVSTESKFNIFTEINDWSKNQSEARVSVTYIKSRVL